MFLSIVTYPGRAVTSDIDKWQRTVYDHTYDTQMVTKNNHFNNNRLCYYSDIDTESSIN